MATAAWRPLRRREREILRKAAVIRARRTEERRQERLQRIRGTCARAPPLPLEQRYGVVYADPPWRFEHGTGLPDRRIENHYPTMPVEAICQVPVGAISTEDALLFLWVPSPLLPEGLRVLSAWGFRYRTCMVWVKDKVGTGYYVRQQHEVLLIGRKGRPPVPRPRDRPASVLAAPRTAHSRKPPEMRSLIERMYPELPRIELFARERTRGWAVWGNQLGPQPRGGGKEEGDDA